MAQYIDKNALVAEIEKRINFNGALNAYSRLDECYAILSILDTLEVKEVDLDEEIEEQCKKVNLLAVGKELRNICRHFFELGLKAQHDNWKVVDNINPPQADKNKIYCVFTKDRHILATVINHPKDEELLQWKCTEFPFHRYDMCEGDKYMQIG